MSPKFKMRINFVIMMERGGGGVAARMFRKDKQLLLHRYGV
jgi:hypothetical protein